MSAAGAAWLRPVLWLGAAFNAAVALALLLPVLPPVAPPFARAVLAWFVALFGAAYAWMARQPVIPRPLVALAAIGKAGVFAIALALWPRGAIDAASFAVACVDLAFAACLFAWLRAGR